MDRARGVAFKLSLTFAILSLILFAIVDRGSPEYYISLITFVLNFVFCGGLTVFILFGRRKK